MRYLARKTEILERVHKYYKENKDKVNLRHKIYESKNKDKKRISHHKWYLKNKHKYNNKSKCKFIGLIMPAINKV